MSFLKQKGTCVDNDETDEKDESQSEGDTSNTDGMGDVGSGTQPDKRGESQVEPIKKLNLGEMALQKINRGRGRPRSQTTSVDRVPKAQDIYALLLEIKDKQKFSQTDIGNLNSKLGDVQKNLDENLDKLNVQTKELDLKLTKLQCTQVIDEEKIKAIECRTNKLEGEIESQKRNQVLLSENHIERVSQLEYELAADIETVKNNIEELMAYKRQTQKQLENRFADFTKEIEVENVKMKENLKEMQDELENLKMQNSCSQSAANSYTSSSTTSGVSSHSNENVKEDDFYMYGDSTQSLILDGIGKLEGNRGHPRPIKLVLKDQTVRDQIYHFKLRLRHSSVFRGVMIHREERKDIRVRFAKLKQIKQQKRWATT